MDSAFAIFIKQTTARAVADRLADKSGHKTYVDPFIRYGEMQGYVIRLRGIIQTDKDIENHI